MEAEREQVAPGVGAAEDLVEVVEALAAVVDLAGALAEVVTLVVEVLGAVGKAITLFKNG